MSEDNELHAIITCSFKLTVMFHSTAFVPCEIYNRKSFVLSQSLSHFSDQPRKTGLDPPSHMETTLEDSSEDMETITGGQFRGNGDHHWRTVQRILDNFLIFY